MKAAMFGIGGLGLLCFLTIAFRAAMGRFSRRLRRPPGLPVDGEPLDEHETRRLADLQASLKEKGERHGQHR